MHWPFESAEPIFAVALLAGSPSTLDLPSPTASPVCYPICGGLSTLKSLALDGKGNPSESAIYRPIQSALNWPYRPSLTIVDLVGDPSALEALPQPMRLIGPDLWGAEDRGAGGTANGEPVGFQAECVEAFVALWGVSERISRQRHRVAETAKGHEIEPHSGGGWADLPGNESKASRHVADGSSAVPPSPPTPGRAMAFSLD